VDVCDIANQFSLGRIAPTTSFARRFNRIFCAGTPKRAPPVAMFQITMNESFDRPHPDGVGFLTRTGLQHFHSGISPAHWCRSELYRKRLISLNE
jgi:hypothetical protein